jgi:hypothetical protein
MQEQSTSSRKTKTQEQSSCSVHAEHMHKITSCAIDCAFVFPVHHSSSSPYIAAFTAVQRDCFDSIDHGITCFENRHVMLQQCPKLLCKMYIIRIATGPFSVLCMICFFVLKTACKQHVQQLSSTTIKRLQNPNSLSLLNTSHHAAADPHHVHFACKQTTPTAGN